VDLMSEPVQVLKVDLPTLKHPATPEQVADFLQVYAWLTPAQITAAVFEKFPHLRHVDNVNVYAVAVGWISGQMDAAAIALRQLAALDVA
jgi:hypothetical protein